MSYNRNFTGGGFQSPYNTYAPFNPYQSNYYSNIPIANQQNQQIPINQAQQSNMPPNAQQIHNTGFVRVQSEEEARRYPVAPGGSVTFIDENSPYCYTKSVDMSQLDRPIFKRFRLVEETNDTSIESKESQKVENAPQINLNDYAKIEDLENITKDYKNLKTELHKLKDEFDYFTAKYTKENTTNTNTKSKKESDKE